MDTVTPLRLVEPRRVYITNPRMSVTIDKGGAAPATVVLSAYNELNRLERLAETAALLPMETLHKIGELHDDKGTLAVVWHTLPQGNDVAALQSAWEAQHESFVDHFFDEQPLLDTCCGGSRPPRTETRLCIL